MEFLGLCHHVDYKVINLWEVDADLAFGGEMRSLLPLVPLMRGGATRERVLQARQELRVSGELSLMEPLLAFFASYFIGPDLVSEMEGWRMDLIVESPLFKEMMRQAEERAAKKAAMDLVADSPLFKELMRQAEERAAKTAAEEAAREATLAEACRFVLDNLDARFGPVPQPIAGRVRHVSDIEKLHALGRRAITASSLEEFIQALDA